MNDESDILKYSYTTSQKFFSENFYLDCDGMVKADLDI